MGWEIQNSFSIFCLPLIMIQVKDRWPLFSQTDVLTWDSLKEIAAYGTRRSAFADTYKGSERDTNLISSFFYNLTTVICVKWKYVKLFSSHGSLKQEFVKDSNSISLGRHLSARARLSPPIVFLGYRVVDLWLQSASVLERGVGQEIIPAALAPQDGAIAHPEIRGKCLFEKI